MAASVSAKAVKPSIKWGAYLT